MENLIGKITASLIEKGQSLPDGLIDKINENIRPPEAIRPDDIYIRAMYLLSDEVNSYGGRFPVEEHDCIIRLLVDCPVLVGHRKDSLPIARTFYAEKEQRDGRNWVKVYFYWLKNSDKGEDLRKNIDGGIYKECSISFVFRFPECSICGSDIRDCRHRPFKKYDTEAGKQQEAFFNYRQIEKVLEVSLVYRGSVHETSITGNLFIPAKEDIRELSIGIEHKKPITYRIWDLNCFDKKKDYFVMPAYESLDVILEKTGETIRLLNADKTMIENKILSDYPAGTEWPKGEYTLDCRLIGFRGKSRLPVYEVLNLLKGEKTNVRRVELKIYDLLHHDRQAVAEIFSERRSLLEEMFKDDSKMLIPVKKVNGGRLEECLNRYGTRYGIEIFDCSLPIGYLYTHRKIIPLRIHGKKMQGKKAYYCLHGISNEERLPISAVISSDFDLDEGDLVEVEVYSIGRNGNNLRLVQPKIIDISGSYSDNIDIAYLLDAKPAELSAPTYGVFEMGKEGVVLRIDDDSDCLLLRGYLAELINDGRRLLAESRAKSEVQTLIVCGSGTIIDKKVRGDSVTYNLQGFLKGRFVLKPIILNGRNERIFYRLDIGRFPEGNHED